MFIQTIKFRKEINVQSSFIGKIKTWIIALTVIALYLVTDIKRIAFFSTNFINYVLSIDKNLLFGIIVLPILVFEILTIISYLLFLKSYNHYQKLEMPNIDAYLVQPHSFKDKLHNIYVIWLDYDFYIKYKNSAGLNNILKQARQINQNYCKQI